MRLDEILEMLPEVGLRLWGLDNLPADNWSADLCEVAHPNNRFHADAATPLGAMVAALALAGVQVDDGP